MIYSMFASHDLSAAFRFPPPRKRIAVGQAQGQVFALKLAEKLAREACGSVTQIGESVVQNLLMKMMIFVKSVDDMFLTDMNCE